MVKLVVCYAVQMRSMGNTEYSIECRFQRGKYCERVKWECMYARSQVGTVQAVDYT